jgi:hypothetical protein
MQFPWNVRVDLEKEIHFESNMYAEGDKADVEKYAAWPCSGVETGVATYNARNL